jgi:beta-glucosidase
MGVDYPLLPAGFAFGTSTAAYPIEGATGADGRGPSIWDTFCGEPGRIADGSSGAVACDHYHRFEEDVALLVRLGVDGYRFSIAWPRVQPTGRGPVNAQGLGFYDRLVDALCEAGIEPMATLYHWDLPQPLQDEGGWLVRDTTQRFAEYAAVVAARLADRVSEWIPVNEPNVVTYMGHMIGVHAPGQALFLAALPVAHHLNLAHGLAAQAVRAHGGRMVGTATSHAPIWPVSPAERDLAAALLFDELWNRVFLEPMVLGRYPDGFGDVMPGPVEDDLRTIAQPLDFYGVSYDNPQRIGAPEGVSPIPFQTRDIAGFPVTDSGWPVIPDGLRQLLVDLHTRYPVLPPIVITANGCAYNMGPDTDGTVHDELRIAYLDGHLRALAEAIAAGVPVAGYFAWSLLDDFAWAEGYSQRLGLVHVDFWSQVRTPKLSFEWFAGMIRANRR